ncbi:MAG TPA: hypothetical protein VFS97_03940 [Nitrososphaeraceae archaeon]|nr:hypothetical protein [Nitrososphaeraceae archaeon]
MNKAGFFYYVSDKTLLVVIGLAVIWVILSSITASAGQEEEGKWLTYENKDLGFSIQYPPSWTAEEDKDLVQLHSNDDETIHVEITSESLPEEKTTLEEYSNMRINDLEEDNKDVKLLHSTSATIGVGDYPAHKVIYKLTDKSTKNQNTVTRFWTVQDDKAYSIAYIGVEPKYFNLYSIALKMFDSFQLIK